MQTTETVKERHARWVEEFKAGQTTSEIGRRDGVTRAMVHLVVKRAGLTREDGGCVVKGRQNEAKRKEVSRVAKEQREKQRGMLTGVCRQTQSNTYRAYLRGRYLGNYPDIESANAARRTAEQAENALT